jgi:hypothetical protein
MSRAVLKRTLPDSHVCIKRLLLQKRWIHISTGDERNSCWLLIVRPSLFKRCMNMAFIPVKWFNDRLVPTSVERPPFYAASLNWGSVKLSLNPWTFCNRSTSSFTACMVRECGVLCLRLAQPTYPPATRDSESLEWDRPQGRNSMGGL